MLGRRHAATHQRGNPFGGEGRQDVVAIVAVQDHAAVRRRAEHSAHHREDELRQPAAHLRAGDRAGRRSQHRAAPSLRFEVGVDPAHDAHQARVALPRILAPHHEAVMRQREPHGAAREPVYHVGHRPRQRESRAHVRHVHDLSLKQLGDQPLGRRVVQVRETHRRYVMSVYNDAVREERVQRCLDAGCGSTSVGRHRTTRHEAHHVGVAHRCGTLERRQFGERQPSESVALDGAQVGPAGLHQQNVAELDRGVATARLDEGRLVAD